MSATLRTSREVGKRTPYPAPRLRNPVARALGALLGVGERQAEREIHRAQRVIDRLPEAARLSGRMDYVARFFSHADAQRQIDATPLTADSAFACLINRSVLAEAGALTDFAADLSAQHRAHLLSRSVKLLGEVSELIVALRAAP